MSEESGHITGLEAIGHRKEPVQGEDILRHILPWLLSFLETGPSGKASDAHHRPDNFGQRAPVYYIGNK